MPNFGQQEQNLTPFYPTDPGALPARARELQRMNIPDEPEPITQLSEEQRVFIYNVGPFPFLQPMGSMGQFSIPYLEEQKVFDDQLSVAGPLVIEGLPKEYYPSEGEARVIYHRQPKVRGESQRPGYNFAMEVIGVGRMVNPSSDLRPFGVFVSLQREQKAPEKGQNHGPYRQWVGDVKAAQAKLREKCAQMCQNANVEYARGKFADIRSDQLYQSARLIKRTELDCPWLRDTGEAADKKNCWSCGFTMKGHSLKCQQCGELQVSQAEFDKEKARRAALNV